MFELREYQKDLCKKAILSLNKYQRVLMMLPTGGGKTVIASALIDFFVDQGKRVLYIVNRKELVDQSYNKFASFAYHVSIIKAGRKYRKMFSPDKKVQIIMIQTYFARRNKLPDLNPDIIIMDEAHDGFTGSRIQQLLADYPDAKILAKTATPCDDQGYLLEGFDHYIMDLQVSDLQELGYLAKDKVFVPVSVDLTGVRITAGDYNENDLSERCSRTDVITNIVENFTKYAKEKQTLVFAVNIHHAEKLTEEFRSFGFRTEVVHSKMANPEDREKIIQAFARKEIQILINVGVLTTGFDCPNVECVVLARPTQVERLYIQMVGRGLRITDKKKECLFLDCGNCWERFGFPSDDRIYDFKTEVTIKKKKKKEEEEELEKILICLACKAANKPGRTFCIECGELLQPPIFELENNQELKEVKKQEITWDYVQQMMDILVFQYGYNTGYSENLIRQLQKLKLDNFSEKKYLRMIIVRIKQCVKKKYKPYWIVYNLDEYFQKQQAS
jgi:superfamily II DNA or RNA helicase